MIISFFGHSDFCANETYTMAMKKLLDGFSLFEPHQFYLGGYGAFDHFAYQCCKNYQKNHPETRLVFVTPYLNKRIPAQKYDESIYPPLEHVPKKLAILLRNQWMTEQANLSVFYVTRSYGGAYHTYVHAQRKGKLTVNLADIASLYSSKTSVEERLMEIYEWLENPDEACMK